MEKEKRRKFENVVRSCRLLFNALLRVDMSRDVISAQLEKYLEALQVHLKTLCKLLGCYFIDKEVTNGL